MATLRQLDAAAERRAPRLFNPLPPLYNLYFAMAMLLVSICLSIFVGGPAGTTFAGGALGVLVGTARQMHGMAKSA
jgi:hypothetical protein